MASPSESFTNLLNVVKAWLIFLEGYILAVCDIPAFSPSQNLTSKDKDIEGKDENNNEIPGLADAFLKDLDEEFDPDEAAENLRPILLLFKDPDMEELFVRTTLLSARVVILRSFCVVALSEAVATFSHYHVAVFVPIIVLLLALIGLTSWKAGEIYVSIYVGSWKGRLALQSLEVILEQ
jgi:hypothetical protein